MEEYFYEVDLSSGSENISSLNSFGLKEIEVSSIQAPMVKKRNWTSEHLLAASLSTSFMRTFIEVAKNFKVEINAYHSQCFVKLNKINGMYIATEILLTPIIELKNNLAQPFAYKCIEEAEQICPIKNSLKMNVEVHPQFKYNKATAVKVTQ